MKDEMKEDIQKEIGKYQWIMYISMIEDLKDI